MKLGKNFQGVDKGSAGYKLMSAMGWKEGEGLGANKQGITEHIKVKKKFDSSGVGAAEAAARARDWSLGMVQYESVLSGLKEVTSKHHKSNTNDADTSSDEEEESSDDEEGQPQKKKQKVEPSSGKKGSAPSANGAKSNSTKSESESSSDSDSGSDSSGSESDDERSDSDKRQPAAGRKKVASHIGRYRKRESAKMVKHYSACDLAAILGTNSAASTGTVVDVAPVVATKTEVKEEVWTAGVKVESAAAAEARVVGSTRQEEPIHAAPSSGPAKACWWSSMFVQAGGIGGQRNEPSMIKPPTKAGQADTININGFSEQDQENLYNKVQNHRSQGRGGLGISDKPKLASGSRWMGTKTRIVDSDEEEEEQEDAPQGATTHAQPTTEQHAPLTDVIVVLPPLRKQENAAGVSRTGTLVKQEIVKQETVKQESKVKQEIKVKEEVKVKEENAADGARTGVKVKQEDATAGSGKAKKVKKEKGKQKDEAEADGAAGNAEGQKPEGESSKAGGESSKKKRKKGDLDDGNATAGLEPMTREVGKSQEIGGESSKAGGESSKKKKKRSEGEPAEGGTGRKQDSKSEGIGGVKLKDGSSDDLSSGEKESKGKKSKKKKDGDKTDGERTEGEKTDGEKDGGRKVGKKKRGDKSEDVKASGDRGDGAEKRTEQGEGDKIDNVGGISKEDGVSKGSKTDGVSKGSKADGVSKGSKADGVSKGSNADGVSKGVGVSNPNEGSGFGQVKWKSVVKKILKEQPKQRLKISKLQQAALEAAEVAQDQAELAGQAMMEEVGKLTSLFEVTAKHVVLCGAAK